MHHPGQYPPDLRRRHELAGSSRPRFERALALNSSAFTPTLLREWIEEVRGLTGAPRAESPTADLDLTASDRRITDFRARSATTRALLRVAGNRQLEPLRGDDVHALAVLAAADLLEPEAALQLLDQYHDPGFTVWYRPIDVEELRTQLDAVLSYLHPSRRAAALSDLTRSALSEAVLSRPQAHALSPEFCEWAASCPDTVLRAEAAASANLHPRVQRALLDDLQESVRAALAANPALDEDVQFELASQLDPHVAQSLASRFDLSVRTQLRMVDNPQALRYLAGNPGLAPATQRRIVAVADRETQLVLLANPVLGPELQHELVLDPRNHEALAANPALLDELQNELTRIAELRLTLAANPGINAEIQKSWSLTGDTPVLLALARNPGACEVAQQILFERGDPELRRALAANLGVTSGVQRQLATHAHSAVLLTANPAIDPGVQLELTRHPNPTIRIGLAFNDRVVAAAQIALAHDPDVRVRRTLACNPNLLAAGAQAALRADSDPRVVDQLLHNPAFGADLDLPPANVEAAYRRAIGDESPASGNALTSRIVTDLARAAATLEHTGFSPLVNPVDSSMFTPEIRDRTLEVATKLSPTQGDEAPVHHPVLSA